VALSRWRRRPRVRRTAWRGPVQVSRPRTCARAAHNRRPACRALTCSTHGPPASCRAQQNMPPASWPPCARIHETNALRQTLPLHQRFTPDDIEQWHPFPDHLTYSAPPSTSSPSIVPLNYVHCPALHAFLLSLAYIQVLLVLYRALPTFLYVPSQAQLLNCSGCFFVHASRPCCCVHSCTLT
jgi:hypothetical protein